MCGIAGLAGIVSPGFAEAALRLLRHRGPDGRGTFEDPSVPVSLAHVRLRILDLTEAAAQPMHSPDGRFALVFNGEIYNFRELRRQLESRWTFRSTGDTEVLLAGLALEGRDFLARLDGIFAFALWDGRERLLLLARDPLGVKPLYLSEPRSGAIAFASEIKALFACPDVPRRPDLHCLNQHLAFCHASGDRTAFEGIRRLGPGKWMEWRDGRLREGTYWSPPPPTDRRVADDPAVLRELLREGVQSQMVSDVPVGSLLSGGIDSSLVTALARGHSNALHKVYTVTWSTADNVLDRADPDLPHARNVAAQLGVPLHEIRMQPQVADLWPRLVRQLDEPIADPAAISSYLICEAARAEGTVVLLSGQGGDELFCGYPRYKAMLATGSLDWTPRAARRALAAFARLLSTSNPTEAGALARRMRKVLTALPLSYEEHFLRYCAIAPPAIAQSVWSRDVAADARRAFDEECRSHIAQSGLTGLDKLRDRDLRVYLPNHNLLYTDKMSMAASTEVRVPLLARPVVEYATALPAARHVSLRETKIPLRRAARGIVPDAVIQRRKAGFGAPVRKWMRDDLGEMWSDLSVESSLRRRGWFDADVLRSIRRRSQEGGEDLYMLQWAVMTVETWAREFLDRNPAAE